MLDATGMAPMSPVNGSTDVTAPSPGAASATDGSTFASSGATLFRFPARSASLTSCSDASGGRPISSGDGRPRLFPFLFVGTSFFPTPSFGRSRKLRNVDWRARAPVSSISFTRLFTPTPSAFIASTPRLAYFALYISSPTMQQPTKASCARIWCVLPVSSLIRTSHRRSSSPGEESLNSLPAPPATSSRVATFGGCPLSAGMDRLDRSTTEAARAESRDTGNGVAESTTSLHSW
mmetsp:Transcript_56181/g.128563  ORF Transcript_56181/g.128563 Transcript_56181/m.128563 type:complete len:235 (-) Transcript_56181:180-884(-)